MSLCLHTGAQEIDYPGLRALDTPAPTASHVPLPHFELVNLVKYALGYYGHEVVAEHHGITEDGSRYFGLLSLKSQYGDYTDTVGLRNSHDKSFPIGIALGSRIFVCDNLAFIGDHVIKRRHTVNSKRDLPGLIAEVVEPLQEERHLQHVVYEKYKASLITDVQADHSIMQMYRKGIINLTKIDDVLSEWEQPTFDTFFERSAWRLFNAATYSLAGRVAADPRITKGLHQIIDAIC